MVQTAIHVDEEENVQHIDENDNIDINDLEYQQNDSQPPAETREDT